MQGALPLCLLCTQLAAAALVPRRPSRCGSCHCLTADALLAPQKSLLPWPHKPVENTRDGTTSMVRWALLTLVAVGETVKVRGDVCRRHDCSCVMIHDGAANCKQRAGLAPTCRSHGCRQALHTPQRVGKRSSACATVFCCHGLFSTCGDAGTPSGIACQQVTSSTALTIEHQACTKH